MTLITQDWGKQFFEGHLNLIGQGKIDEIVDREFAPDAAILSFVDYKDTPPPHTVQGSSALKVFFQEYLAHMGVINILKMTELVVLDDLLSLQVIFSCDRGVMLASDTFQFDQQKRVRRLIGTCFRVNP